MIHISEYCGVWPENLPIWQNRIWFECWDRTFSKVYILEKSDSIIPICINHEGKKEYASWQATDFVFPMGNWNVFKNEKIYIPHLVDSYDFSECRITKKIIGYVDTYPKSSFLKDLIRRKSKLSSLKYLTFEDRIPKYVIEDILYHKKLKYNTDKFYKISLFIEELYYNNFPLIVHAIYNENEYISGNIGLKTHRGFGHWIVSYNNQYKKFSPGHLLILFMLEESLKNNVVFDFMRGNDEYKNQWQPVTNFLYETIL